MFWDMPDFDPHELDPATVAVWGGEDRYLVDRATQVPVVHSVSFGYDDFDTWQAVALGEDDGHIYGRNTNPTVAVFEEKLRALAGSWPIHVRNRKTRRVMTIDERPSFWFFGYRDDHGYERPRWQPDRKAPPPPQDLG